MIAYQFGLLDPVDWDQDCHEHLWRQNKLWNQLVEIERDFRSRYRELIAADPEIARLQARIEQILEAHKEANKERKGELRAELKAIKTEIKERRTIVRSEQKARVAALESERFNAAKHARKESGLYWGNYNAVVQSYETGRRKAAKEGVELRFHRFSGEGRFSVQVQNGCTFAELADRNDVRITEARPVYRSGKLRGGRKRAHLVITIHREGEHRTLSFPIILHRPVEGRIQQVCVTRRRIGTHWRHAAIFTCRTEARVTESRADEVCGINLGFRVLDGLRVATIVDEQGWRDYRLAPTWMDQMDALAEIQSRRDHDLNAIQSILKHGWTEQPELPEALEEDLSKLIHAPKYGAARLAASVLRWRTQFGSVWMEMLRRLEHWRKIDKKDLEQQAHLRERLALNRREQYRLLARNLAQQYSEIRIGYIDLREIALRERDGEKSELHQTARRNRTRASLYLLQREIEQQARKHGSRVRYVDTAYSSNCNRCGASVKAGSELLVTCSGCGTVWDQDHNAAVNILREPLVDEPIEAAKEAVISRGERMTAGRKRRALANSAISV